MQTLARKLKRFKYANVCTRERTYLLSSTTNRTAMLIMMMTAQCSVQIFRCCQNLFPWFNLILNRELDGMINAQSIEKSRAISLAVGFVLSDVRATRLIGAALDSDLTNNTREPGEENGPRNGRRCWRATHASVPIDKSRPGPPASGLAFYKSTAPVINSVPD